MQLPDRRLHLAKQFTARLDDQQQFGAVFCFPLPDVNRGQAGHDIDAGRQMPAHQMVGDPAGAGLVRAGAKDGAVFGIHGRQDTPSRAGTQNRRVGVLYFPPFSESYIPMFGSRLPFLLLLVFPLLELYLLIKAGGIVGAWPVVLWVIVVGLFGVSLIQSQGMATAERVRAALARGETPALGMLEGLVVVVAGVLLLIPGLISDAIALALLIPPVRQAAIRRFLKKTAVVSPSGSGPRPGTSGSRTLEGEYRRED